MNVFDRILNHKYMDYVVEYWWAALIIIIIILLLIL